MYNEQEIKSPSSLFDSLKSERTTLEDTWETCARYTIPHLYLSDSDRKGGIDPEDLILGNADGAECFNNFVSQISKIVFPYGNTFYRNKAKMKAPSLQNMTPSQRERIMLRMELEGIRQLNRRGLSSAKNKLLQKLLGLGDVVFHIPDDATRKIQVFDHNNFVIRRLPDGTLLDLIIKESVIFKAILPEHKATVESASHNTIDPDQSMTLYTHVYLDTDIMKLRVVQFVDDILITKGENFYTTARCPYKAVSLNLERGSNYGTGIVSQYLALLHKALTYADTSADTAVTGSLVNWAVHPNAGISPEEFANRDQGDAFVMNPDHVRAIVADVGNHLAIVDRQYSGVTERLHRVFLMYTAFQRDAERVTAEEVRRIAAAVQEQHSGLTSSLGSVLQHSLAEHGMQLIEDEELVEYIDDVEVDVVSAFEAHSRSEELERIMSALADTSIFNTIPPQIQPYLEVSEILSEIFTSRGVTAEGKVKPIEQVQQEQEQAAQREAAASAPAPQQSQTQVFTQNDDLLEDIYNPTI